MYAKKGKGCPMSNKRSLSLGCTAFLGLALGTLTAQAQTNFWWTNAASGTWVTSASWTNNIGAGAPGAGGSNDYGIIFQNPGAVVTTNDLATTDFALNRLQFSGSNTVTIAGGTGANLVFTNSTGGVLPQVVQNTASSITLNIGLVLAANTTFAGSGAGTVTLNSNVTGTGMLIMNGPYTMTLVRSNAYSGGTLISQGTLRVVTNNTLGTGNVTIGTGGALDITGCAGTNVLNFGAKIFTIAGTGVGATGALVNNGVSQFNAFQKIVLSGNASVGGSQRLDVRGGVATLDLASNTLTKVGAGTFGVVGGTVSDGNIVISNGVVRFEANTLFTGTVGTLTIHPAGTWQVYNQTTANRLTRPVNLHGGAISFENNAASRVDSVITLTADSTLNGGASAGTFYGPITEDGGSFGITKTGASLVSLAGTNTYTGGTVVSGGNLQFNNLTAIPAAGLITLNAGGALNATGAYTTVQGWLDSGRIATASTGAIALTFNSVAPMDFALSNYAGVYLGTVGTVTNSGTITPAASTYRLGGGGTLVLTNDLSLTGANALVITDPAYAGTVTLTGSNTFSGGTLINGTGVLNIFNNNALGTGSVLVNVNNTGGLVVGPNLIISNGLVLTPPSGLGNYTFLGGSNSVWAGPITLSNPTSNNVVTRVAVPNGATFTISGVIGGSAGSGTGTKLMLNRSNTGTLLLTTNNTYTAYDTLIYNGTLKLGVDDALPVGMPVEMQSNSATCFDLNGHAQTIGSLFSTGGGASLVTNSSASPATLTITASTAPNNFAGLLADGGGGGTLALVINHAIQILSGTNNPYSGGTTLANGALLVLGSTSSIGTGTLTLGADTGIGLISPVDQTFLNWVTATAVGTPQVILLGGNSASNLTFGGSLANTFLGAAGGTYAYSGNATWADTVIRLGGGSSNLLYVPTIGAGTNLLVGPLGGNAASVVILTNAANNPDSTVIQSGTLQLGNTTTGLVVIGSNPITISNGATLAFKYNSGTALYTNTLTGGGGVNQAGTAPVFLATSNSYSGGTVISAAGRIGVGDDTALGTGPILFTAAGFLSATGTVARTLANALVVSNNITLGSSTDTGTLTFNGTVDLGGASRQLSASSPIIMNGVIANGGLNKAGTSSLILGATNLYTLGTILTAGTLSIGDYPNLPAAGPVTFSGGMLQITGTTVTNLAPYTVNWTNFNGGFDIANAGHTLTLNSNLTSTATLTKIGPGVLVLAGTNSLAQVTVNGGLLTLPATSSNVFSSDVRIGNAAGVTGMLNQAGGFVSASGGNGLLIGAVGGTGFYTLTSGTLSALMTGSRGILLGVNTNSVGIFNFVGGVVTGNQLQVSRADTSGPGSAGYFYQAGGSAGFASLWLAGGSAANSSNNYALLAISNGTFRSAAFSGLASGNNSTGQIYLGTGALVTLPAFPTTRGTGAYADITFDGGLLSPLTNSTTYLQALTHAYLTSNGANFNVGSALSITVSQNLENAAAQVGSLTKSGPGTLILAGTNSFGGGISLQQGSLLFSSPNALPASVTSLLIPFAASAGVGYPLDQAFINTISNQSAGTVALGANSGNPLNVSSLTNVSLGALNGTWTNSGVLTPFGDTYRLGGGGGTLVVTTVLTDQVAGATGLLAFGSGTGGTVVLAATNAYTGSTTLAGGTLSIGSYSNLPLASPLVFSGGILQVTGTAISNLNPYTVNGSGFDGGFDIVSNGFVVTVAANLVGSGALTKLGSGTLLLSGANSYTGPTLISGGLLQIGAGGTTGTLGLGNVTNNASLMFRRSDTYTVSSMITGTGTVYLVGNGTFTPGASFNLPPAGRLALGETNGTVGNLDLGSVSEQVGSLVVSNHSLTAASSILIGSGQSLTVAGLFQVGAGVAVVNNTFTTKLTVSGPGSLIVTNPGGTIQFGNANGNTKDSHNLTTVDMSGLGTFIANLGTNGTFRLGSATTETGVASNITTFASNTLITAGTVRIDHQGASAGAATVRLGAGTNSINANTINVGVGDIRAHNTYLQFATNTGTLSLRAADGIGAANLTIGVRRGTGILTNVVDLTGHAVDLNLNLLDVGGNGFNVSGGSLVLGSFALDAGTTVVTTVRAGSMQNLTTNGLAAGVVTFGGGVVQVGSGGITLATNFTVLTSTKLTGTLNVSGGAVTVGTNSSGNSLVLTSGNGINNALVNLTGGQLTLGGHAIMGAAGGANTATVTLAGATLDLTGHNLGSGAQPLILSFQSGTLLNVNELNGGAPLVKTTGGTLVLAGANAYSGGTLIGAGTLVANSATALGSGTVAITNALLRLAQSLTISSNLSGNTGAYLDLGAAGTVLTVSQDGNSTFAGSMTNAGGLVKAGKGTLTLSGVNRFSGSTTINSGTLQLGVDNALPATSIAAAVAGNLDLGGYNLLVSGVDGYLGVITNSGAGSTLTVNLNSATQTFDGTLAGPANFTVQGGGKLNVSGTSSAGYTGNVSVSNATVLVQGTLTGGGLISVFNGGTLGGTGALGNVQVYSGGSYSPGYSPGTQLVVSLTLNGGLFQADVVTSNTFDRVLASNGFVLAPGTTNYLHLALANYVLETGASYLLVQDNSGTPWNGNLFTLDDPQGPNHGWALTNGASFMAVGGNASTNLFSIAYNFDSVSGLTGSGNDILLTVIPEPASVHLLVLSGMVYILRRRLLRKRRGR